MTQPRFPYASRVVGGSASLGMYDGGELTSANDRFWEAMAARLRDEGVESVPDRLARDRPLDELWSSGRLLFGQTCGAPLAARLRDELHVVGAPVYGVPGATERGHRSFIVVNARSSIQRLVELRGARAIVNDDGSLTGRHLLGDAIAGAGGDVDGFFRDVSRSGSHAASLASVARGDADVAAIDCVSYAHITRASPSIADATRILEWTREVPSLPFVISTAYGARIAALVARALRDAASDPATAGARRALRLTGIIDADAACYDAVLPLIARADRVFG